MIGIPLTSAAYRAIKTSLLRTADATPRSGPDALVRIWLDCKFVERLGRMRDPGETYSDIILRLAASSQRPCGRTRPRSTIATLQAIPQLGGSSIAIEAHAG